MSDSNQLVGTPRDTFGKGVARKLRAIGQTPAVVYGHGTDPVHISLETHPLSLILRQANALIEVDVDGKKHLVLVKDVQKDPVRQIIEHVDLIVVKKGETVEVEVPVHVVGEPFSGTNALQELNTLRLSALATSIPESVEVNVEGLEDGTQILAGAVELPKGASLLDPADALVVNVVAPRGNAADDEADAEEAAE
ncbi:50S ribosomal protein L25/general stress protein Ctc [Leucobacter luti]|uniref:Large ribosomal subunit protein bL25 n=1 Tax=Leucobacter luti TaxID=340320 RepID=A0A4Q7U0C1_9MICO|nr:50S ribosomal protein L25/general stress protein Ctc [Leucobacter luti]MBL3698583.1 50S ribosomal protein L25/general stress protein Ctc [Leucobacter luti]RZT65958.1 large subunit ribosomal protein L25 [Leucobacter luti]